ncbi:MAG TPA: hypothetical protein VMQ40_03560 [Acidimicrobiales bacterium]|nr:hypothetical protein [Acidimicrobiales bacterium]
MSVRSALSTRAPVVLLASCLGAAGAVSITSAAAAAARPDARAVAVSRATAPTVTSLSVSTINRDESIPATVRGSGFESGAKVSLGKGISTAVKSVTATTITVQLAVARDASFGTRSLTVTNPQGGKDTLAHAAHVDYAPVLAKWAVGDGAVNWMTSLVRPVFFAAPALSFSGRGVSVASESLGHGGRLDVGFTIASGAAAGWRTMTITEGTASWKVPDGLRVRLPPIVTSVAPLGQGEAQQTVRVTGSNFEVCKSKEPTVAFSGSGVSVDSVSSALGNLMYVKLTVASNAVLGPRDVTVTNCDSGGVSTSTGVFHVVGLPTVTSIPPIAIGVTRNETVRGTNLTPGTTLTVAGADIVFSHLDWLSSTKIRATISVSKSATLGPRDVTASDTGGGSTISTGVLSIDPLPTETSALPKGIGANTAIVVTVVGTGFEPGAIVSIGSAGKKDTALLLGPAVVDSATKLRVVVSATAATTLGAATITVTNPDGGAVSTLAFTTDPGPVLHVASSTTTTGALEVTFTKPSGSPASEVYAIEACTNAALSAKCVDVNAFKSGRTLEGLVAGDKYYVAVTAPANGSYFASMSNVVGPYRASARLQAPVITKVTATSTTLRIAFTGASNGPKTQNYTARACLDAAMTKGCVTRSHYDSGATFTGVHKAKYYVQIFAVASAGYLPSSSKVVAT